MMVIMEILHELLNEVDAEPPRFPLRQGSFEVDLPILCNIEKLRIRIEKMNNNFVFIEPHSHLNIGLSRRIVLHHVGEEFFHGEVENIADLVVDGMGERKLVREIKNILELLERAPKASFHDLSVHNC